MVLKYTNLLGLQEVIKLGGDLLVLPPSPEIPIEEAIQLKNAGIIDPSGSQVASYLQIHAICAAYCRKRRETGKEPDWVGNYPLDLRLYCRVTYAQTEEDALFIVPSLPRTSISYIVLCDGLCHAAFSTFKLWRLGYIKQLGFLQAPISGNSDYIIRSPLSNGTRLAHSLDVAALATLIANNIGLPKDQTDILRVAALTHDVGTPAGGDSVKSVDPEGLDEDANYASIVSGLDWVRMRQYVRKEDLPEIINGKGLLGEILDIADKIAYTARDIEQCQMYFEPGFREGQLGLRSIMRQLEIHPYACAIWDSVVLAGGHPCFTDIGRLVAFLKVRVLMFREVYYNPGARFQEYFPTLLFVRTLYKEGLVTKSDLLSMTDSDLIRRIDDEFDIGHDIHDALSKSASCDSFPTLEEAERFAESQRSLGMIAAVDDHRRSIKPGTNLLVRSKEGNAVPLSEEDPSSARELVEMATMLPAVRVYSLRLDSLPERMRARLAKHFL